MDLGPQGDLPLRDLPCRFGQREGLPVKLRVGTQKGIRDTPVFPLQNGTGGVHQHTPGLHIAGGVVQNGTLYLGQSRQRSRILFPVHRDPPKSCFLRALVFCVLLSHHKLPDSGTFSACFRNKTSKKLIAANCFVFFNRDYLNYSVKVIYFCRG